MDFDAYGEHLMKHASYGHGNCTTGKSRDQCCQGAL